MILWIPSNPGYSLITGLNWLRHLFPWCWSHSSKWHRRSCDLNLCCYMGYSTGVTRTDAALGKSPYIYLHFFFFLKRYGSFLVCTFSHPHPLCLGEEGVRGKTKMVCNDLSRRCFFSALFPSVRDGSDAGGEIAPLFLLRLLGGQLGRHEKVNKLNSVLFTPEKIWVSPSIETLNVYQIYQGT